MLKLSIDINLHETGSCSFALMSSLPQTTAVAEAESEVAARTAEYKGRVELLLAWLDDVDSHQLEIGAKERASDDDKRILQVRGRRVFGERIIE